MFEQFLKSSHTNRRLQRIAKETGNTVTVKTDGYNAVWSLNGEVMKDAATVRRTMKPAKKEK